MVFIYRAEHIYIFFYIYTILTFSLAAAHVDDVAEVKAQKTVKWGS